MDNLTPTDPMLTAPAIDAGKKPSFLATNTGKLVLGGVAIVLVAAAAVAAFFLFFSSSGSTPPAPPAAVSKTTTATPSAEASPTEPPRKSIAAVFTFRNIFKPSSLPISNASGLPDGASPGANGTAADFSSIPADTLYFVSVGNNNGQAVGNFFWNGTVYSAGGGARLGDTPWEVISLRGSTATLLFGDTQVTLSVGQGLTK